MLVGSYSIGQRPFGLRPTPAHSPPLEVRATPAPLRSLEPFFMARINRAAVSIAEKTPVEAITETVTHFLPEAEDRQVSFPAFFRTVSHRRPSSALLHLPPTHTPRAPLPASTNKSLELTDPWSFWGPAATFLVIILKISHTYWTTPVSNWKERVSHTYWTTPLITGRKKPLNIFKDVHLRPGGSCAKVTMPLTTTAHPCPCQNFVEAARFLQLSEVPRVQQRDALAVAARMAEASGDGHFAVAALLHGAVASGAVGADEVAEFCGAAVAHLTENCARMVELSGAARDLLWSDPSMMRLNAQQATTMQNMVLATADDWRVVTLVLADHADRLAHLSARAAEDPAARRLGRQAYVAAREALDVYAPLAHRLGMGSLKDELEDLAFRHLHPQEHEVVVEAIAARFAAHEAVLGETLSLLKRTLQEDTVFMNAIARVTFEARAKQPYSVWRKMLRQLKAGGTGGEAGGGAAGVAAAAAGATDYREALDRVLDHLALRVVVDPLGGEEGPEQAAAAEALCYHVLGLVHSQWAHVDFRVKDFLAAPKPNGYRSLHTTALSRHHGALVPFEVQVRTREMHRVAEWGRAAHADYKATDAWGYLLDDDTEEAAAGAAVAAPRGAAAKGAAATASGPLSLLSRAPDAAPDAPADITDGRAYAAWVKADLASRRVFVFMKSAGRTTLWDLERGMSIKEAIWRHRACRGVDEAMKALRVNGRRVAADYTLCNGDAIFL